MGTCESSKNINKIKINGEIKDIANDYLLEESIKTPITDEYKFIDSKIGHGSFSRVILAMDNRGKSFAIKIMKKSNIIDGKLLANEVRIGTNLHHGNILEIKEVYEDMKSISFVMEYCEGGDLLDFITKSPQGKLDDKNTIDILLQILSGINYLHNEVHVCHRDIKPDNFLITINEYNRPIIKLIDFGMAHYISEDKKMIGKAGTFMYMAPEILQEKPYDEKVDIWSVGIVLYNMLSGHMPFTSSHSDLKMIQMEILNRPVNFDVIKNNYLRDLCQEMMERDPNKRIDSRTALEKAYLIKRNNFPEI